MSTATFTDPAVREFADAVREHLSDLSADEIDDLTDGLEADLAERADDVEAPALGDPRAYADELRSAAGLPARGAMPRPRAIFTRAHWSRLATEAADEFASLRANPVVAKSVEFLVAIRAFWWVVRGWVGYQMLSFLLPAGWGPDVLPNNGVAWLFLLAAVVVSVQWGRGKWLPFTWMKVTFLVASTIAAIIVVPLAFDVVQRSASDDFAANDCCAYEPYGLQLNGATVSNIFAYDADGEPIAGAQLFDQNGNPLAIMSDETARLNEGMFYAESSVLVPNPAASGSQGWNVFPLFEVPQSAMDDDGSIDQYFTARSPRPPFAQVQPLVQEATPPSSTP